MSDQHPVHRSLQNQFSPAGLLTYSNFRNLPIVITVVYLRKLCPPILGERKSQQRELLSTFLQKKGSRHSHLIPFGNR